MTKRHESAVIASGPALIGLLDYRSRFVVPRGLAESHEKPYTYSWSNLLLNISITI